MQDKNNTNGPTNGKRRVVDMIGPNCTISWSLDAKIWPDPDLTLAEKVIAHHIATQTVGRVGLNDGESLEGAAISAARFEKATGIKAGTVRNILGKLRKSGVITKVGSTGEHGVGIWKISESYWKPFPEDTDSGSSQSDGEGDHPRVMGSSQNDGGDHSRMTGGSSQNDGGDHSRMTQYKNPSKNPEKNKGKEEDYAPSERANLASSAPCRDAVFEHPVSKNIQEVPTLDLNLRQTLDPELYNACSEILGLGVYSGIQEECGLRYLREQSLTPNEDARAFLEHWERFEAQDVNVFGQGELGACDVLVQWRAKAEAQGFKWERKEFDQDGNQQQDVNQEVPASPAPDYRIQNLRGGKRTCSISDDSARELERQFHEAYEADAFDWWGFKCSASSKPTHVAKIKQAWIRNPELTPELILRAYRLFLNSEDQDDTWKCSQDPIYWFCTRQVFEKHLRVAMETATA